MDLSSNFFSGSTPHCFQDITFGKNHSSEFNHNYVISIAYTKYGSVSENDLPLIIVYGYYSQEEANFITKNRLSSYVGSILNYMSGLDLSCNNLTGGIPFELGQLSSVRALNLSHNQLTGSILETFSNLVELESLDISFNSLSGKIPPKLIELHFLVVFSVAYNNLSGRTPEMKQQFGTFTASSNEGNPFLCGLPLEKSCTNIDDLPQTPTKSSNVSDEKWYEVDQVVFFASFSISYIMFFLGVITLLYVNPYWRLRCFNLIESCMYSCYYFVSNILLEL